MSFDPHSPEQFAVVVVPFPFTDRLAAKRRPALVLSLPGALGVDAGHSVLAMITSAANPPWPHDVPIGDLGAAGLGAASVVRMKLFTLDDRLIIRQAGRLAPADQAAVRRSLASVCGP